MLRQDYIDQTRIIECVKTLYILHPYHMKLKGLDESTLRSNGYYRGKVSPKNSFFYMDETLI